MEIKGTKYRFEVCTASLESVRAARAAGAERAELCAGLAEGGITPSIGTIRHACALGGIDIHPIIRPRGGDFLYSGEEVELMCLDIRMAIASGVKGVVVGALTRDGRIDLEAMRRFADSAEGVELSFHRAFDYTADPYRAIDELAGLGVGRILSSGQRPTALVGVEALESFVRYAGERLTIMPGCGITPSNIAYIAQRTRAREFHFSARVRYESQMELRKPELYMGREGESDEYTRYESSEAQIRATIEACYLMR